MIFYNFISNQYLKYNFFPFIFLTGYINSFLAWKAWIPLAKLNFGAYLVHLIVMNIVLYSMKTTMHWSWVSMVSLQFADIGEIVLRYDKSDKAMTQHCNNFIVIFLSHCKCYLNRLFTTVISVCYKYIVQLLFQEEKL